jgi:hypothetical protein
VQARAELGLGDEAGELRAEGLGVAGGEEQAVRAVARDLLVDRERRGERHGAGGDRAQDQAGGGQGAVRGRHHDVGPGEQRVLVPALQERHPVAQVRAQGRGGARPARGEDARLPVQGGVERAQRAHERPQRAALLRVHEADDHAPALPRRVRPHRHVGARRHDLVAAREVAAHELRGGRVGGQPRVEPAEDQVDQAPGDLGGHDPLGRGVERPDVQGAGVAQRDAGHGRRERLVDVAEVERRGEQELLHGPRDVDGQRGPPARGGGGGQRLADREHPHLAGGAEDVARADLLPGAADQALGEGRREDRDPVPAGGQLLARGLDAAVDLVPGLPGVRGHLRDDERLGGGHAGDCARPPAAAWHGSEG